MRARLRTTNCLSLLLSLQRETGRKDSPRGREGGSEKERGRGAEGKKGRKRETSKCMERQKDQKKGQ